jgi:hypothetical protein
LDKVAKLRKVIKRLYSIILAGHLQRGIRTVGGDYMAWARMLRG